MSRLVHVIVVGFFILFTPRVVPCAPQADQSGPGPTAAQKNAGGSEVPQALDDLMRVCRQRFQEGAALIESGDSGQARAAFDAAVDSILRSDYDLSTQPVLAAFFQDLVIRIQREESLYLLPDQAAEEAVVDELGDVDLIPIEVDPALKDRVEADILDTKYDIPIVLNQTVLKCLNYWLDRGRRYFTNGFLRSGRYREMIQRIFREESLPQDLMYLAHVESLFKTNALSRARAKGIWQFSRSTAIRYGLKVNRYIDERSDPEKSTRAAAHYLHDLYDMFGDWNLVLAAYNWGEGKVQRLVKRTGKKDFWQLCKLRRGFPRETKNHVPMILSSIILARNPEKYGLPKELESPPAVDSVELTKTVNLRAVAKILDVRVDELKSLNPELRGYYTPPEAPGFHLNVPAGMGSEFEEKIAELPDLRLRLDPAFDGRYKVRQGETLSHIARRYHTSALALQEANDIRSPRSLRAGTWIYVPGPGTGGSAGVAAGETLDGRYRVRPGDTLSAIAAHYGISAAALQAANGIRSPRSLRTGTVLQVPSEESDSQAQVDLSAFRSRHQVQPGETLSEIAVRYGTTVTALQRANKIRSPRSLRAGTWILVPSPSAGT